MEPSGLDDCIRRLRATLDNLIDVTGLETGKMRFFHKDYDFLDTVRRAIAWQTPAFTAAAMAISTSSASWGIPASSARCIRLYVQGSQVFVSGEQLSSRKQSRE